jgi:hypothetical protein
MASWSLASDSKQTTKRHEGGFMEPGLRLSHPTKQLTNNWALFPLAKGQNVDVFKKRE